MFVGRILFLLGMAFVFFSSLVLFMIPFANSYGDLTLPLFGLINGFMAMGVGDIVIDLNHRRRVEKMDKR